MKRKVIKQGNGTLTITLPKQWTEKVGLKGGDDIDIELKGQDILVTCNSGEDESKTSVDLSGIKSKRAMHYILAVMHKMGFMEVEIFFDSHDILKVIHDQTKNIYTGFVIMEQTKNRAVLRAVSKDSYSELEPSMRRAFLVALSMGDAILERLKNKDHENLSELVHLEKSNNQFVNFCERLLVKKGCKEPLKTCFKYNIAWNLEKVCDCFKEICVYIDKKEIISLSKEWIKFYTEVLGLFRVMYEHIYKFNLKDLDKIHSMHRRIDNKLRDFKFKNHDEYTLAYFLKEAIERCINFSASTIALNFNVKR